MAEKKKEMNFEEALKRLEEIVGALDDGSAMLDESMELFEEGVKLVKFCNGKLENAEKRVKILVEGENGEKTEQTFEE